MYPIAGRWGTELDGREKNSFFELNFYVYVVVSSVVTLQPYFPPSQEMNK